MAQKYDLDAEQVPRKESAVFALVDDAVTAVEAIWQNAEAVLKQTGGHKPVLFIFEENAVLVIAVQNFFEDAEGRMNFMQFIQEIASTRDGVDGVVLAMESQYLDVGVEGLVGQDADGSDMAKRSLVVMAEWRTGDDCARRADIIEIEDSLGLGAVEDLPDRGLHEFGGVFR